MVLMRAPLGTRGSFLPTAINVVQCLGWTVFELLVIATAAAALSDELLGFGARWRGRSSSAPPRSRWACSARSASCARCCAGSPSGSCRSRSRYLGWWALTRRRALATRGTRPGEGGLSTWQAIDIVVGVTVSWVPLAADYTRFARSPRGAFWGTGIGYLVPDVLLLALGAVILLTRELGDAAALPAAVAAGGLVGAPRARSSLTVGETDEAFANAYSGAVSLQNLVPQRAAAAARSWRRRRRRRSARSRSS